MMCQGYYATELEREDKQNFPNFASNSKQSLKLQSWRGTIMHPPCIKSARSDAEIGRGRIASSWLIMNRNEN